MNLVFVSLNLKPKNQILLLTKTLPQLQYTAVVHFHRIELLINTTIAIKANARFNIHIWNNSHEQMACSNGSGNKPIKWRYVIEFLLP